MSRPPGIYVPTPYPDELLFSILARWYHHLRREGMKRQTFERWLFSGQGRAQGLRFPTQLEALSQRVRGDPRYAVERLIDHHTLTPIWAPFMDTSRWQALVATMRHSGSMTVGQKRPQSPKTPRELRYCTECVEADLLQWNETYWHRVHQAPGVSVCPYHGVLLYRNSLPAPGPPYPLPPAHTPVIGTADNGPHQAFRLYVAREMDWLLSHPLKPQREKLAERYSWIFTERGMAQPIGGHDHCFMDQSGNVLSTGYPSTGRHRPSPKVRLYFTA